MAKKKKNTSKFPSHIASQKGDPQDKKKAIEFTNDDKKKIKWIIIVLGILVTAVYGQVINHQFINYDDGVYVYENEFVKKGLSVHGIQKAFTDTRTGNWHPITWISHMVDCQIFGLNPGGHHLVNVIFHFINSVLLFLFLFKATREFWPSALTMFLFSIHPLHVESVAWVAERKDVLTTFFCFLALNCYTDYVKDVKSKKLYLLIIFFICGLLAKSMIVTLPFMLLLLDLWPFHRIRIFHNADDKNQSIWQDLSPLIYEKWLLFIITGIFCIITIVSQKKGGAVSAIDMIPMPVRLFNAVVVYVEYIFQMIWPINLSVFYPHPHISEGLIPWHVLGAIIILLIVTVGFIMKVKTKPFFLVGWLWYIGTLFPVIGIVQVGLQQKADRYTYIPLVGIFILIAWGTWKLTSIFSKKRLIFFWGLVIIVLSCISYFQVAYWKTSLSLFSRAIELNPQNHLAHNNIGACFARQKKYKIALSHFKKALNIYPFDAQALANLGGIYLSIGQAAASVSYFEKALKIKPGLVEIHNNLGVAKYNLGLIGEAIYHFKLVLEEKPNDSRALFNLKTVLSEQNRSKK